MAKLEPNEDDGKVGLLVFGQNQERLIAHTRIWPDRQYLDQRRTALIRVLQGKPSALITDMRSPVISSHLVWWPMWRVNDEVVFHNQLLFFDKHEVRGPGVDAEQLYEFIGEQRSHNAEGPPLSEWSVSVTEIEAFLGNMKGGWPSRPFSGDTI